MHLATPSLDQQTAQHLYRKRPCIQPLEQNLIDLDGKLYINFSSNDYLGLSQHEAVIEAMCLQARSSGVGSTASRMVCGHQPAHQALEQAFAEWLGYEQAVLFSNGYMANLGLFEALRKVEGAFCLDKLCHVSLLNGVKFTQQPFARYQHLDLASMERQLQQLQDNPTKFLVTESLFSMDGDMPHLNEMTALAQSYGAELIVDDAHAIGVLGATGKGSLEVFQLNAKQVPILILPLGKAFGSYGALILTNAYYRELLLQFATAYTYTTNIPAPLAQASLASLHVIQTESWRRERLQQNIHFFQERARYYGLEIPHRIGPIQISPASTNAQALALHEHLKSKGFFVQAIRAPTVPMNQPRLRITLNCNHDADEIDTLLKEIAVTTGRQTCWS
jgi:8-amino-7-oxononanoate synthase